MAGIYLHIPFCFSRCGYCDFFKTTKLDLIPSFIESLKKEIEFRSKNFPFLIETIYFGGGTPSLLKPELLREILKFLYRFYNINSNPEITIECNPDDLSTEYLDDILQIGFNRISIGIQSFDDKDLRIMSRRHNSYQAFQVVENASLAGFKNIGVDFIYGLPWSDHNSFKKNLDLFVNLPVQHLSAYHLSIEKGTSFFIKKRRGEINDITDVESLEQYLMLCKEFKQKGMIHYEVSNFCMPGYYSLHNSSYWKGVPYIGFGPGSHSFVDNKRSWNKQNVNLYISQNFNLIHEEEILNNVDSYNEMIMLGFRTIWGVDIDKCKNIFPEFYNGFLLGLNKWCKSGYLFVDDNHLKCSEEKWFQIDGVIEDFIISND